LAPEAYGQLIRQNVFSIPPRVQKLLTVSTLFKSLRPEATETQGKLLAMSPWKIEKKFTCSQDTTAQSKHFHFKREEWGHRNGPKKD
jgi:hypothetical protein